jgi:hypothetical protein
VTVRRSASHIDIWEAIPGETRWVDYSHQHAGDTLVVYIHTFRRVRERFDSRSDLLLWKPATTGVAHRYREGDWDQVVRAEQQWPPVEVQYVARRPRRSVPGGHER